MRHIRNTLYITIEDSWVHKDGETITIRKDNKKIGQFPIHHIGEIICMGYGISVSPQLVEHCAKEKVTVTYIDGIGKFLARLQGPVQGNVLLRRAQYRAADNEELTLMLAKCCVSSKIQNQRTVLLRHLRNHPNSQGSEQIKIALCDMATILDSLRLCENLESLRGYEGTAAEAYFSVFNYMVLLSNNDFRFEKRSKRPPKDRINAMLSYAYSILALDIRSALEAVGIDPYVGYLHKERPGRPSLALDIMEEFRAPIADRLILKLINMKQVAAKDFEIKPSGEVLMGENARRTFLEEWQKRKRDEIFHPFFEEKLPIGLIYLKQARLLARFFRGDLDYYPAFIWR
jgi:CRISPR-associated protein Cas1